MQPVTVQPPAPPSRRTLYGIFCVLFLLLAWISTGTLAPYASSHHTPTIDSGCGYLLNIDHETHRAPFLMLDGAPPAQWEWSVVLRRILYPLLAYPAMKVLGFHIGGVVFNVVSAGLAIVALILLLYRFSGERSSPLIILLFITYPGIFYWSGLPYSYAFIVPGTIASYFALTYASSSPTLARALTAALAIGVLSTAYDFLPFFGGALLVLLAAQRRWGGVLGAVPLLILPTALVSGYLWFRYGIAPLNPNTDTYRAIVQAYITKSSLPHFLAAAADIPHLAWTIFLNSNFIALPCLALVALACTLFRNRVASVVDISIVTVAFLVFLVNNLAPPYEGWQLRGEWIARLYQPLFVVEWVFIARAWHFVQVSTVRSWLLRGAITATILAQALVVAGPLINVSALSDVAYHRFYLHAPFESVGINREKYGAHLLGMCR